MLLHRSFMAFMESPRDLNQKRTNPVFWEDIDDDYEVLDDDKVSAKVTPKRGNGSTARRTLVSGKLDGSVCIDFDDLFETDCLLTPDASPTKAKNSILPT